MKNQRRNENYLTSTEREFMRNNFKEIILLFAIIVSASNAFAQTTEFTYQGQLQNSSVPANGSFDFEFLLFDAVMGPNQVGPTLTKSGVTVTNGVFSVKVDFGSNFPGEARFLELHVRPQMGGAFTSLSPRQAVSSAPYAVKSLSADAAASAGFASNAGSAMTATAATDAAQLGGIAANQYLTTANGNASYIRNSTSAQTGSNFNISGNGHAGGTLSANVVQAGTQFNIGLVRILSGNASGNIFGGQTAGINNTTGVLNTFFGNRSGEANTGGSSNSFFGERSGLNSLSINNSFFGAVAGQSNTSGSNNTIIGTLADVGSPALTFATALGAGAVVPSSNTVTIGRAVDTVQIPGTLSANSNFNVIGTGSANIFNATSQFNLAGVRVLSNGLGANDFYAGSGSGGNATGDGYNNSFFGTHAGYVNTYGNSNSFFGSFSGQSNTTGEINSFFGVGAGINNNTGSQNSFFGNEAGHQNTSGNSNSFFGFVTGTLNTTGINNTLMGFGANVGSGDLTNATAIGSNALVSQSNSLVLGSFGFLGGVFDTKVGIGTATPSFRLHVVDSQNFGLRVQNNTAGGSVASFGGTGAFQVDAPGVAGGRLQVTESGNVGIGTDAPNAKLQVAGGSVYIAAPNSLIITSPNGACWFIKVSNTGTLSTLSVPCP